jgi:transketolase
VNAHRKVRVPVDLAPDQLVVTTIRTLSIDAVQRANSGHPGAPMGLAPIGWMLFGHHLRYDPLDPQWPNRDRFVLSAGHASALLYSLLHLTGYAVTMDDLKEFRQWGSATPGHPERGDTPGVEVTTGPLGQGFGNAVGLALAECLLAQQFNRPGHEIVDHRTWFICSDGDLMEGISYEAASFAGHLGLGKLIGIYDHNSISLDGPTSLTFTENVPERFDAAGWRVLEVADGNDLVEIDEILTRAQVSDGRPTLIVASTHIGYGSPHKQDSAKAHGSPLGVEEVAATKRAYGWPEDAEFLVPEEVAAWAAHLQERGRALRSSWQDAFDAYAAAHPDLGADAVRRMRHRLPDDWRAGLPQFAPGESLATRASGGKILNALAARIPELVQGAADLSSSTDTTIKDSGDIAPTAFDARNIRFGVREHSMGAISNGLAAHGGLRPVCSTFMMFSDYMKNTVRMAALQKLPVVFVYTHDSVGLGEDGPTHQPIEHLAALRAVPGLVVFRPADATEAAGAWEIAIQRTDGPSVLVLSRQGLPTLARTPDVARGAYVLRDGGDCILLATGSEVPLVQRAADVLSDRGIAARVVSMPSWELFLAQPRDYQDRVLPPGIRSRVSVEAAATLGWHRFVGLDGIAIGIDRFGASAPGDVVMAHLGITVEAVVEAATSLVR